ncbi:MAG: hypothetical protein ACYC18_05405 [Gammaproteobacteria bacterium]
MMGVFRTLLSRYHAPLDDPRILLVRFLGRYMNRTIIVHRGLPVPWLTELLKEPGGAGHFRFDARPAPGRHPTPIEWLAHRHVLPFGLPVPLIVLVREDALRVRHLLRKDRLILPSEIPWLLDEIDTRYHALLRPTEQGLAATAGIPPDDNRIEIPYGA